MPDKSEDIVSDDGILVRELGMLAVPSGRVRACDPFLYLSEGLVVQIEPGIYPVRLCAVDISEPDATYRDVQNAYVALVFNGNETVALELAGPEFLVTPMPSGGPLVPVDLATAAFVDAEVSENVGRQTDEVRDDWLLSLNDPDNEGRGRAAMVRLPWTRGRENMAVCASGIGDGGYPLLIGRDPSGTVNSLWIDFQILDFGLPV